MGAGFYERRIFQVDDRPVQGFTMDGITAIGRKL